MPTGRITYTSRTTLLLLALSRPTNPDIIMRLIEAGDNVNTKNSMGETPLHLAIAHNHHESILLKLIEKGADINAQNNSMSTPLYYAVTYENLAAMYILLYHNVDVSISLAINWNFIMHSFSNNQNTTLAQILLDYCVFDDPEEFGVECLYTAIENRNRIAIDLVKAGVNINYVMPETHHPIYDCIKYPDSNLFKEMWPKVDCDQIIQGGFLLEFIQDCHFPTSEWLECCYLILNCSYVSELVDDVNYSVYTGYSTYHPLLYNLFITFYKKNIQKNDRLAIIYILLSYGAIVDIETLQSVYVIYGSNEELEALIQATNQYLIQRSIDDNRYIFLQFYVLLEERIDIFKMIRRQIRRYYCANVEKFDRNMEKKLVLHALQLFSITHEEKSKILRSLSNLSSDTAGNPAKDISDSVMEKFKFVPEVPSLTEMCRNEVRKFIKQTFKVKQPYQFYDVLKKLNIPSVIQDIISLKVPIYVGTCVPV